MNPETGSQFLIKSQDKYPIETNLWALYEQLFRIQTTILLFPSVATNHP